MPIDYLKNRQTLGKIVLMEFKNMILDLDSISMSSS